MGRRFTAVLDAEWQGVLDWKWNSKRPLVSADVILTKTLVTGKVRDIWERIDNQLDLWYRGIHAVLMG